MIVLFPQKVIQRFAVGKGCIGADRSVSALPLLVPLFLAVGFQRRCVEGHHRCAGGLCAYHAFDAGMQNGDGRFLPRDQTTASFRPFIAGIGLIPCLSDLRHVLCVNAVHTEDQIAALEDFLPFRGQRGVFFGALWIPAGKEPQNGLCHGMGDLCQKFPVLFGASHEALQGTFRLALVIATQNIAGVLAQEIRCNSAGFFRLNR